jgi:hypothetical protein
MRGLRVRRALLAGLALSGCAPAHEDEPRPAPEAGAEAQAPTELYRLHLDDVVCQPTLESLQQGIFTRACGFDSCHGGSHNAAWGLSLIEPDVRELLVDDPSRVCSDWIRVVPGSPERSLLWRKLTEEKPPCGVRMPMAMAPLPDRLLACIEEWIRSLELDARAP